MIRIPEGRYMTVKEYARSSGLSHQAVYAAIKSMRLKAYRVDTVWLIPDGALVEDRRIRTGKYVGISAFRKTLDVEKLAKDRGLL